MPRSAESGSMQSPPQTGANTSFEGPQAMNPILQDTLKSFWPWMERGNYPKTIEICKNRNYYIKM